VTVDRHQLVAGQWLAAKPAPSQPTEQLGMGAWRDQVSVQNRMYLVLNPSTLTDDLVASGHEPA